MDDSLIVRIDAFLEATDLSASAFGRAAVGDPNFVRDLREGREPKRRLVDKVDAYIRNHRPARAPVVVEAHS
jgi:2,4-dienoyl-CoA reductase-like NADH-dependent reductase (Old Yellow Enzyme family)